MKNYFKTGRSSECCGCTACVSSCPKGCIEMRNNEEGFAYPHRDLDKCIECGLCEKVCPFADSYQYQTKTNPDVFAAYDKENRTGSSSGGLFYTLAKYAIEQRHGWVFGAAFDDELQLKHIGVNTMSDLQKLRGSKYLQSAMGDTYSQIKALLKDGVFLFFVGTPCQVAGLRAFLKNKEYDNLLTADLVCHGVPPQSLFDEHVRYLEANNNAKLISYQFRKMGGWGVCEIADFANPVKHKTLPSYDLSPYLYSFMHSYTYRESCYECKFASMPRQGDITLADYWGVRIFYPLLDYRKGVSLVLLNTDKAANVWDSVKQSTVFESSSLTNATKFNWNIEHASKRPAYRDEIFKKVKKEGYIAAIKRIMPHSNNPIRIALIKLRETVIVDNMIYYMRKYIVLCKMFIGRG